MLAKLRPRLTYANVMATIAVFLGLGGSAYAVATITGADVVDESLTGSDIRGKAPTSTTAAVNGTIASADIHGQQSNAALGQPYVNGGVTTWDIADNTVRGLDINESSLAKVPDADKLDGIDSKQLVTGGGKVSFDRAVIARGPFGLNLALQVPDFGYVVGTCDERGLRIGFYNTSGDGIDVFIDDAGSPSAYDGIGNEGVMWAPFHAEGRAITTFHVGRWDGQGERVATIWASGRIPVGDPPPDYCIVQAQALSHVG